MGFRFAAVSRLKAADDADGEISIVTTSMLEVVRSVNIERRGVCSQLVKETKEHIQAEKNLRGQTAEGFKGGMKNICQAKKEVQCKKGNRRHAFLARE